MGLLIYLDDLKGSSVVVKESANSYKAKLAHVIKEALTEAEKVTFPLKPPATEPQVLTLQGWHKLPLLIMRPLERIIYCVEQPDRELQEMMDHHAEAKKQRQDMMKDPRLIKPN